MTHCNRLRNSNIIPKLIPAAAVLANNVLIEVTSILSIVINSPWFCTVYYCIAGFNGGKNSCLRDSNSV